MSQLVTLDKYKAAIGETSDDFDDVHTEALEDASQAAINFTDRDFGAAAVTEARDFQAPDVGFIINIDDCSDITAVEGIGGAQWRGGTDGPAASFGVFTYIEVASFRADSPLMGFRSNLDQRSSGWLADITVTATWGWPTVPDDVQRAIIWIASDFEAETEQAKGGLQAKSVAEVAENYAREQRLSAADSEEPLSRRARALLAPYRRLDIR